MRLKSDERAVLRSLSGDDKSPEVSPDRCASILRKFRAFGLVNDNLILTSRGLHLAAAIAPKGHNAARLDIARH